MSPHLPRNPLVVERWISNSLWKRCGYGKPICFLIFLQGPLCLNCMNLSRISIYSHCFVSMAARSSDLDDQKSGVDLQTEGHTLTPPSSQNGPEDPEAFGSAPSQSQSLSPARKPDCHEIQYCLEIQVISTKDSKATPPPSHAWQVPSVEDIV